MAEEEFVFEGEATPPAPIGKPADTGRSAVPDGMVPHHVVGGLRQELRAAKEQIKAWEELGLNPQAAKDKVARLEKLSAGRQFTDDEAKEVRTALDQAYPGVGQMTREWQEEKAAKLESVAASGEARVGKWIKELGLAEDDPNANTYLQEAVAGAIARDKELYRRLKVGHDPTVWDEAFGRVRKALGLGVGKRVQDANIAKLKKGPVAPVGGGPEKTTKPEVPKSDRQVLSEKGDEAFTLLQAGMEE